MKSFEGIPVHHFDPEKAVSALSILNEFSEMGVFAGGSLGKAFDVLVRAKQRGAKIFMSLAGAMVPGGMRKVIVKAIESGLIDLLVTTGANCTHDLIEAFDMPHLKDVEYKNDGELRERGIDRVYDSFVPSSGFPTLEEKMQELLKQYFSEIQVDNEVVTSSHELIAWLGNKITDENSIIRAASKAKISIYVPVIADSVLGLQIWLRSQYQKIIVDEMRDISAIQDEFHESDDVCAFILGGGVPKNYMLQSSLLSDKEYNSGVSVTMDRVESGGLSGATLNEAVSWGKFTWEAEKVEVKTDNTIALPLIVSAWLEFKKSEKT